jgi:DNA-binding transcriptional MerR regulator
MFKTKKLISDVEPPIHPQTYSSADVAELAGVSLRQLQWWDEEKVVSPKHEGHRRLYSITEVIEITVIAELRRKGFSLQKIRKVLTFLQKEMGKRLSEVLENAATNLHLVTDGQKLYLEVDNDRVIDILKSADQPMFLVCVSDQVKRLKTGSDERKPAKAETLISNRRYRVS